MNSHADKSQEQKSQSASFSVSQMQSTCDAAFQFTDNRLESVAQRKLQGIADHSTQVSKLGPVQELADNNPKATQAAQLMSTLNPGADMPIQLQVEAVQKNKKYSREDAVKNLEESRKEGDNKITATWIGYIIRQMKPKAGRVLSTYVSSFDTAKGGFSASRELPEVKELVVHAHYKREKNERDKAKVNSAQVKWSDDESGDAPPGETKLQKGKEPEVLGSDHEKVAIKAWEENSDRHTIRQDAEAKKAAKQKEEPLDLEWLFPSDSPATGNASAPTNASPSSSTPPASTP